MIVYVIVRFLHGALSTTILDTTVVLHLPFVPNAETTVRVQRDWPAPHLWGRHEMVFIELFLLVYGPKSGSS